MNLLVSPTPNKKQERDDRAGVRYYPPEHRRTIGGFPKGLKWFSWAKYW